MGVGDRPQGSFVQLTAPSSVIATCLYKEALFLPYIVTVYVPLLSVEL